MTNLIEDVFILENMQIISEGRSSGPMKIRGTFQRADEENNNKRIYPRSLLSRELDKLQEAVKERRLMGELDHPQHDSVKLNNVSHLITKLEMKGNEVIGEAEVLNTPAGQVVKALIEGGVKVGISSRGLGTLSEGDDGKRYVNEDFKLVTWDMVADPSTRGAYPGLTESTEIQNIIDDVLPRANKMEHFKVLLREAVSKLDEAAAKRVGAGTSDEYVSAGKTGKTTLQKRLLKTGTKKASASAETRVKTHTAGPKGMLPDSPAHRDAQKDAKNAANKTKGYGSLRQSTDLNLLGRLKAIKEMRDKTPADQEVTLDNARKKAFQAAHRGEGRRSKQQIMAAYRKRSNQIKNRLRQSTELNLHGKLNSIKETGVPTDPSKDTETASGWGVGGKKAKRGGTYVDPRTGKPSKRGAALKSAVKRRQETLGGANKSTPNISYKDNPYRKRKTS